MSANSLSDPFAVEPAATVPSLKSTATAWPKSPAPWKSEVRIESSVPSSRKHPNATRPCQLPGVRCRVATSSRSGRRGRSGEDVCAVEEVVEVGEDGGEAVAGGSSAVEGV